jgi:hypothetical protein
MAEEYVWLMRHVPWLRRNICASNRDDQQTCHNPFPDDVYDEMSYTITVLAVHGKLTIVYN